MAAISDDILKKILQHIQRTGSMPQSFPGVDQEDLHDHFTYLWIESYITGRKPYTTGLDKIVRNVIDPKLTQKGIELLQTLV